MNVRKFVIAAAFMILLLPQCTARAASSDEQEVKDFIDALYEAKEKGDEDLLVSFGASEVQIITALTLAESGVRQYHNLESHIYRGGEDTWFVAVVYEIEVEGLDVWLPETATEYVIKNDRGELQLPWQTVENPPEVNKFAELAQTDPEIVEMFKAGNDAYYKLLDNDTDGKIMDFNSKVRETYDKILLDRISMTESNSENDKDGGDESERFYTVRTGDCLWSISEEYFGSGESWTLLYKKNRDTVGESPDLIFPGQVLDLDIG